MHECEGLCAHVGHVCMCTQICACLHMCVCEREVDGMSYFSLHVLIFTPVDCSLTKPFSASLFHNIPAVCIYSPFCLLYICYTWSFYLMLIFIFQVMKGILLSFLHNTCILCHLPNFPVVFFNYILPTITCVNHCGHHGVATVI
jgi:hypothetical protein